MDTYRLMKVAICLVYPLAIFSLLPFILWSKKQLSQKSPWIQNIVLVLAIAHTVFHIHKTFDLNPYPVGNFTLTNNVLTIWFTAIVGYQQKNLKVKKYSKLLIFFKNHY